MAGLFATLLSTLACNSFSMAASSGAVISKIKFGSVKPVLYGYGHIEVYHARTAVVTVGYRRRAYVPSLSGSMSGSSDRRASPHNFRC